MDLSFIINELGEEREQYFMAMAPPIIQTSNFSFKKVDDLRSVMADEMSGHLYSRGLNPTVDILRKKLAALDGAEDCLVFNNGAAAQFAAVLAHVKSGDNIVCVAEPYAWVQRMCNNVLPRFGVTTTYIDGGTIEDWEAATKANTTLFYLESPNSWNFALQPIREVCAFARSKGIVTLADNSYCSPIYQNVIEMGVDMALQTASKYIGGHSDTLGGVLSGSHCRMKKVFQSEYLNMGNGIQPFNAWLLIRSLRTLPSRLDRISRSTDRVVRFLKAHDKVELIIYPFDESFPQHDLAKRQMKAAPGLFSFVLRSREREAIEGFCTQLKHISMAVSWGGHESLVIPRCATIPTSEFDPSKLPHRYIRMYVGLEDPEYLIEDLKQALELIPETS